MGDIKSDSVVQIKISSIKPFAVTRSKMTPFVISILAILSVANADVSHLSGYQYQSAGHHHHHGSGVEPLKLHSLEVPAPTQYQATYGDSINAQAQLPNSYVPPPSGSPFESSVPLPAQYPAQQLSAQQNTAAYQTQNTYQYQQPQYQQAQYQQAQYQQPQYQQPQYQQQTQASFQNFQQNFQQQLQSKTSASSFDFGQQSASSQQSAFGQQSALNQHSASSLEPIVTKHFYVHAAPEEPEEESSPKYVPLGRSQTTYKIIFIKAPEFGSKSRIIPILPQNEEKTIVYVLSKKPQFSENIELPEFKPKEPIKPEVFFIKYKTQKEAEQAQQSIQAAYDSGNVGAAAINTIGAVNSDTTQDFDVRSTLASNESGSSAAFGGQEANVNYQQHQHGESQTQQHHEHHQHQ